MHHESTWQHHDSTHSHSHTYTAWLIRQFSLLPGPRFSALSLPPTIESWIVTRLSTFPRCLTPPRSIPAVETLFNSYFPFIDDKHPHLAPWLFIRSLVIASGFTISCNTAWTSSCLCTETAQSCISFPYTCATWVWGSANLPIRAWPCSSPSLTLPLYMCASNHDAPVLVLSSKHIPMS